MFGAELRTRPDWVAPSTTDMSPPVTTGRAGRTEPFRLIVS